MDGQALNPPPRNQHRGTKDQPLFAIGDVHGGGEFVVTQFQTGLGTLGDELAKDINGHVLTYLLDHNFRGIQRGKAHFFLGNQQILVAAVVAKSSKDPAIARDADQEMVELLVLAVGRSEQNFEGLVDASRN